MIAFKRCSARPGKHGNGDKRVEIAGVAPTHSETIWMLGHKALAERRYRPNGYDWLRIYALAVVEATSDADVDRIAWTVDRSVKQRRFIPLEGGRS